MHPLEGILYESAILVPLYFTHHPFVLLVIKIDLTLRAVLGHDGYDYPGSSNWYHYLHHTKVHCNYGTTNAPFDWLFGSWDYGVEDWKELKAEREKMLQNANE